MLKPWHIFIVPSNSTQTSPLPMEWPLAAMPSGEGADGTMIVLGRFPKRDAWLGVLLSLARTMLLRSLPLGSPYRSYATIPRKVLPSLTGLSGSILTGHRRGFSAAGQGSG